MIRYSVRCALTHQHIWGWLTHFPLPSTHLSITDNLPWDELRWCWECWPTTLIMNVCRRVLVASSMSRIIDHHPWTSLNVAIANAPRCNTPCQLSGARPSPLPRLTYLPTLVMRHPDLRRNTWLEISSCTRNPVLSKNASKMSLQKPGFAPFMWDEIKFITEKAK